MRLRHVAGQREQQRHRVLGRGDRRWTAARWRRRRRAGGGVDVDVVDAHPGPRDRPQPVGLGEQVGVDLGGRADQDAVEVGDAPLELGAVPAGAELDVEAGRAQQLDAGVADLLGDEDLS